MQEVDNASTTNANATRGSVYTIHTNKYIEHLTNKPTTTVMSNKQILECTYTSCRCRVIEKARTRTLYFKNIM